MAILKSLAPAGTSPEALAAAWSASEGDTNAAALVLWWDHRSNIVSSPLMWSAQGDYSEDRTANLEEINRQVAYFEQVVGVGAAASGTDPGLPTLSSAPLKRIGRDGLFIGEMSETSTVPVVSTLSATEQAMWDKLQAISDAIEASLTPEISAEPARLDLRWPKGDAVDLRVVVHDSAEVVKDVSAGTLVAEMGISASDPTRWAFTIDATNANIGELTLTTPTDPALPTSGVWDLRHTVSGITRTLLAGNISIEATVSAP